jgi:hypothetical protein
MAAFESEWRRFYPNADPTGWMMRRAGARHWLRFHSLPGSKRYPENDDERRTLLARQNALGVEVLGSDGACWLAQTVWESSDWETSGVGSDPREVWPRFAFEFAYRFLADEGDDEEYPWDVYASRRMWLEGAFDDLLIAIAEDRAAPTLWMSPASGTVFAPYDGGVDLFLPDLVQVDSLKAKHPDWLSTHPQGF